MSLEIIKNVWSLIETSKFSIRIDLRDKVKQREKNGWTKLHSKLLPKLVLTNALSNKLSVWCPFMVGIDLISSLSDSSMIEELKWLAHTFLSTSFSRDIFNLRANSRIGVLELAIFDCRHCRIGFFSFTNIAFGLSDVRKSKTTSCSSLSVCRRPITANGTPYFPKMFFVALAQDWYVRMLLESCRNDKSVDWNVLSVY